MQREIKFRAWDKEKKRFEDDKNVFINQCGGVYCDEDCGWYDDRYEIQMYTGLKDKNGKDIYEGDVVKCHYACQLPFVATVQYIDGCFDVESKHCRDYLKVHVANYSIEVIGNIHENPELLEVSE